MYFYREIEVVQYCIILIHYEQAEPTTGPANLSIALLIRYERAEPTTGRYGAGMVSTTTCRLQTQYTRIPMRAALRRDSANQWQ